MFSRSFCVHTSFLGKLGNLSIYMLNQFWHYSRISLRGTEACHSVFSYTFRITDRFRLKIT